jgi:hypothetical protein
MVISLPPAMQDKRYANFTPQRGYFLKFYAAMRGNSLEGT